MSIPSQKSAKSQKNSVESTPGSVRTLFEFAMKKMQVKSYSRLAKMIGFDPSTVCRMISNQEKVSASMILALHEHVGIPVADIRKMVLPEYIKGYGVNFNRRAPDEKLMYFKHKNTQYKQSDSVVECDPLVAMLFGKKGGTP